MKKYMLLISILIVGIFIGYLSNNIVRPPRLIITQTNRSMNDLGIPLDTLKCKVITTGDTQAYDNLLVESMDETYYPEDILFYSLFMANKYNNPKANFDVYLSLTSIFEHNKYVGSIDNETKELALKYLKRGAELKEFNALNRLSQLYLEGKYVEKDSILGRQLELEADQVSK